MNPKIKKILNSFSYTFTSNLIILIVNLLVTLIMPKFIGLEEYAYWQLYVFYMGYVGFFHFGWADGIYLRYGGKDYDDLDKKVFANQLYLLAIMELTIAIFSIIIFKMFINGNELFILMMIVISGIITNIRYFFLFTLQATNKMKDYAKIIYIDRFIFCLLLLYIFIFDKVDYKNIILMDILSRIISSVYTLHICKNIVFRKIELCLETLREAIKNISVGCKLMLANIVSNLIIGIVRLAIEYRWGMEAFSKVSFAISISHLLMIFINATALIIFPLLRRSNNQEYSNIYINMRNLLMTILLASMILYYPVNLALKNWLPNYSNSLRYMALMFPMFIFESKISLLTNTFLKTIRKESWILTINIISVLASILTTAVTVFIMDNLYLALISIVFLLALKSIISEVYLSRMLKFPIKKNIILELICCIVFMLVSWFVENIRSTLIYTIIYFIYLTIKKTELMNTYTELKLRLLNY